MQFLHVYMSFSHVMPHGCPNEVFAPEGAEKHAYGMATTTETLTKEYGVLYAAMSVLHRNFLEAYLRVFVSCCDRNCFNPPFSLSLTWASWVHRGAQLKLTNNHRLDPTRWR
jgi:hypothetical protein